MRQKSALTPRQPARSRKQTATRDATVAPRPYLWERARAIANDDDLPWEAFDHATVLVTGASGLIGSQLVRTLLLRPSLQKVIVTLRDAQRSRELFGASERLQCLEWASGEPLCPNASATYVICGAAPTASRSFVETPVEVIRTIVDGALATLEYARAESAQKVVLLSTMEVYGEVFGTVDEHTFGVLDPMIVRNSYPEAKRLAECLFSSFAQEYALPACVLRLAQCFGEGVASKDARAFADFGRRALAGEKIVLYTDGTKKNARVSVDDAVRAIIVVCAKGHLGEAYNAANEATYGSVVDLASTAIATLGSASSSIVFAHDSVKRSLYPPSSDLRLDASKLIELGWKPRESLKDMFLAMARAWEEEASSHASFS